MITILITTILNYALIQCCGHESEIQFLIHRPNIKPPLLHTQSRSAFSS